ncbi:hypothetical protein FISHEDRAFT_5933, partial [Fistulina hepatica ATCC 64428]
DLSASDRATIRHFTLKVDRHLGDETFERLRTACPESNIDSWHNTKTRVAELAGFTPVNLDTCIKSCICYTGPHVDLIRCPYCQEPRFNAKGRPRKQFQYLPLIPRLVSYYKNEDMVHLLQYRAEFDDLRAARSPSEQDCIEDIFDSQHYQRLRTQPVVISGKEYPHRFFDSPRDIALGMSTDGFAPFKHRSKTC